MKRRTVVLGLVLTLAASHCSSPSPGPTAGTLLVALAGAGATDRAILIEIAGSDTSAAIDTVTAAPGSSYRVFSQRQTRTRWRAIVTGALANGTVVQVGVPNAGKSALYSGAVLDVADASFAELAPSGRTLSVAP